MPLVPIIWSIISLHFKPPNFVESRLDRLAGSRVMKCVFYVSFLVPGGGLLIGNLIDVHESLWNETRVYEKFTKKTKYKKQQQQQQQMNTY